MPKITSEELRYIFIVHVGVFMRWLAWFTMERTQTAKRWIQA